MESANHEVAKKGGIDEEIDQEVLGHGRPNLNLALCSSIVSLEFLAFFYAHQSFNFDDQGEQNALKPFLENLRPVCRASLRKMSVDLCLSEYFQDGGSADAIISYMDACFGLLGKNGAPLAMIIYLTDLIELRKFSDLNIELTKAVEGCRRRRMAMSGSCEGRVQVTWKGNCRLPAIDQVDWRVLKLDIFRGVSDTEADDFMYFEMQRLTT